MKNFYLFTILICLFNLTETKAQENPLDSLKQTVNENLISPQFPEGTKAFQEFIQKGIRNSKFKISQKIYVEYIVEKDGSLTIISFSDGTEEKTKRNS